MDWHRMMAREQDLHNILVKDKKRHDFSHSKKVVLASGYNWDDDLARALSNVVGRFQSERDTKSMIKDSKNFQKNEKIKIATKTTKLPPKIVQRQDNWGQASYIWIPYDAKGHSMTTKIGCGTFMDLKKCEYAARNIANTRDPSLTPASYYIPHQVGVYSGMGNILILTSVFRKGEMILPT